MNIPLLVLLSAALVNAAILGDQTATGTQPEFHEYLSGGLYKYAIVLFNPSDQDIELSGYSVRIFIDSSWKTDTDAAPTSFFNLNAFTLKAGESFVACSDSTDHEVQLNCDQHYAELTWTNSDSFVFIYGTTSGDPAYDNNDAFLVDSVDSMDEYFPAQEITSNTIARHKDSGNWEWEVLPDDFKVDIHLHATPSPTAAPTAAPTFKPCDSTCSGLACEAPKVYAFEPPRVDTEQCRSEFGFCARKDSRFGSVYCNNKAQWKECCLEKVKPVSANCSSTCSSDPCPGTIHGNSGSKNQCRGLDGQCGTDSEHCDVKSSPHEVVLHRGFPEQNTTYPLWLPCCKDDGFARSVLRRDEGSKWTSYCSHVYCQSKQARTDHNKTIMDLTIVHHHNLERNGQKHVCKHGLHEHDKCGCECYGQEFGDSSIQELIKANVTTQPECEITYARCEANSSVIEDTAVMAEWNTGDGSQANCASATKTRWLACGGNGSVVSYIYRDLSGTETKSGFGDTLYKWMNWHPHGLEYNVSKHHSLWNHKKPLRETKDWTSYCSHVYCVVKHYHGEEGLSNVTEVRHHNKERFGSKHVCKMHLHHQSKCGCECYNEDFGDAFALDSYDQLRKNTTAIFDIHSRYPTPAPTPSQVICTVSYKTCNAMQSMSGTKSTFNIEEGSRAANKGGCHDIAEDKWKACDQTASVVTFQFVSLNGSLTNGGFGGGYNYMYTTHSGKDDAPPEEGDTFMQDEAPPEAPLKVVHVEYMLDETVESFSQEKQDTFKTAIALEANVTVADVTLVVSDHLIRAHAVSTDMLKQMFRRLISATELVVSVIIVPDQNLLPGSLEEALTGLNAAGATDKIAMATGITSLAMSTPPEQVEETLTEIEAYTCDIWEEWSTCTVSCGTGVRTKHRKSGLVKADGTPCVCNPGTCEDTITQSCNENECEMNQIPL